MMLVEPTVLLLVEPVLPAGRIGNTYQSLFRARFLLAHFELPDTIGESGVARACTRSTFRIRFRAYRGEPARVPSSGRQIDIAFFALELVRIQIYLTEPEFAGVLIC